MQTGAGPRWHPGGGPSSQDGTSPASIAGQVTVLVLLPDRAAASAIRVVLEEAGASVRIVGSVADVNASGHPDLVVLGVESVEEALDTIPVLCASGAGVVAIGPRLSIKSISALLNAGADDWIASPFHPDEFRARCLAVLRRRQPPSRHVLTLGPIEIDIDSWWATVDGRPVPLTREDWLVLAKLARKPGAVVSHAEIVGAGHSPGSQHSLARARVGRLRRRLAAAGVPGEAIRLAEGHGYRLDDSSLVS